VYIYILRKSGKSGVYITQRKKTKSLKITGLVVPPVLVAKNLPLCLTRQLPERTTEPGTGRPLKATKETTPQEKVAI
jgi:hypothetical protein